MVVVVDVSVLEVVMVYVFDALVSVLAVFFSLCL